MKANLISVNCLFWNDLSSHDKLVLEVVVGQADILVFEQTVQATLMCVRGCVWKREIAAVLH